MGITDSANDNIRWFRELDMKDRPAVGGKGASLGELAQAGIAIPDGFVVTTTAFRTFIRHLADTHNIFSRISTLDPDNVEAVNATTKEIRALVEECEMPEAVRQSICSAHASLCDNRADPVAVRSSATSEDSEEASFAGLQDTFLWVKGADAVCRWVRTCWASLYNPESVTYRLRLNIPEDQLAMGVVVQRMVDSRCSGVMFTRSPTSGDRSVVVIEGSWGLGSCIVSGEVTPDKFVVNKITGEISKRDIASKTMEHIPKPEGGVLEQAVASAQQNIPCLSDDEVKTLAGIARQVEKHYGKPQDIEWAISREGETLLLQSRPETVWASRERQQSPVAKPAARAFEHVFAVMGGNKIGAGRK